MKIAIDYDKTFTADPMLWEKLICFARQLNHQIVIVTCRTDNEEERVKLPEVVAWVPVIYTNRKAKRKFINADIWIDDQPYSIDHDCI